jgi:hypothetical protein
MNVNTHSATSPGFPVMLRRLLLASHACLLALGLSSCSLMPIAELSPLPSDLRVGMTQYEVKHRLGLPDQVQMITQKNPVATFPDGSVSTTLAASTITAPTTPGISRTTLREVGELWLYRDYWWNERREGAWSVFGTDNWGSWDLYFDNRRRLRAWKFVEAAPGEAPLRGATWLRVPPKPET